MFKPMLAVNTKIKDIRLPSMVSYKMEGVRGEFTPNGLFSRPMKKFNNRDLQFHFADLVTYAMVANLHIEGEFYVHGLEFNEISSICRRANHPDTDRLEVHLFDVHDDMRSNVPFLERHKQLHEIVTLLNKDHIKIVPQIIVDNHEYMHDLYTGALEEGYEGLVFKSPSAFYKYGRPTHREQKFLRIKPDCTFDGVVLDIVERLENLVESVPNELGYMSKTQDKDQKGHTDMAAVAIVQCDDFPDPVRVVLSKNLTDQDRYYIWSHRETYIGKHLRFFGIPVAGMNQPRCPRFDCWRTDLD